MDAENLTIHVRSPSLTETLVVNATIHDKILSVKQSLQNIHPYNPDTASQRLIYAGRQLKDEDILSNVLNKVNESNIFIFHLVVKPGGMNPVPQPRKPVAMKAPEQLVHLENEPNQNAGGTASAATSPIPTKLLAPPLAPSGTSTQPTLPSPSYSDTTPGPSKMKENVEKVPETTATSYPNPEIVTIDGKHYLAVTPAVVSQIEAYEQYLVTYQQYYTQWYQWYNANYVLNTIPGNAASPQGTPNTHREQPTAPVAEDAEAERQRAARRATVVWLAAKLMLVLFVLTRNASIPRMIFIYVCAFVFFLYQTGQLRFIVRRVRPWRNTPGKRDSFGKKWTFWDD
ncbi:hypothetical protein K450DRAFT_232543 [Umbelopsis ramanniana AG]|uniref:Ubiquitin-like domain-containing protein n=1 Tax=Umbelopsis ramanniana AG TaxID=1314678 RepID=A0AAD5ED88_UMBRA|nr:uncharacterized protein K450DRAFT_232543 [Umbelopsis ramanniana AG]KAI8581334.1 hypothetical protein K450DRAFT_232543 [Umbelopsis ramanniana AG]